MDADDCVAVCLQLKKKKIQINRFSDNRMNRWFCMTYGVESTKMMKFHVTYHFQSSKANQTQNKFWLEIFHSNKNFA